MDEFIPPDIPITQPGFPSPPNSLELLMLLIYIVLFILSVFYLVKVIICKGIRKKVFIIFVLLLAFLAIYHFLLQLVGLSNLGDLLHRLVYWYGDAMGDLIS